MSSTSHMSAAAREAEEYRDTSFEIWEAMAGWERWRAQLEER